MIWGGDTLVVAVATTGSALEILKREVAEMGTVVDSAITLIHGMADQIRSNAADRAALEQLATELDQKARALAQSVQANTTQ